MVYNLTNITKSNDLYTVVTNVNDMGGAILFVSMLLILFIVFLTAYKKQSFKEVAIAGSFFMAIVSTYAFTQKWIDETLVVISVVLLFASILMYIFIKEH